MDSPSPASFASVVVAFDGSAQSRDALALGELLARTAAAELTAVGVYLFHPIHRQGDTEMAELLREEMRSRLDAAAELATDPRPRLLTVPGRSVPQALHRVATAMPADLLVLGSSHRGAIGRVLAGSTTERALQAAPCPVAVAPRGYGDAEPRALRTIGVGFDGSREATAALELAAALARTAGAQLQVITAFDPHIRTTTPQIAAELEYAAYLAEGRDALAAQQQAAVAELSGVDATAIAVDGEGAGVLSARSHELDLLVLGSRCYGPLRRVMLGSVSTRLLREVSCPLLVLPRTALSDPDQDASTPDATASAA